MLTPVYTELKAIYSHKTGLQHSREGQHQQNLRISDEHLEPRTKMGSLLLVVKPCNVLWPFLAVPLEARQMVFPYSRPSTQSMRDISQL